VRVRACVCFFFDEFFPLVFAPPSPYPPFLIIIVVVVVVVIIIIIFDVVATMDH
jgi:hypothetical protein